ARGLGQALPRGSLRRIEGRAARLARRASLRRPQPRAARGVPRKKPSQRRPPDAARGRAGGRSALARLAGRRRTGARQRAGALVARAGVRRAGRGCPQAGRARRGAARGAVFGTRRPPPRAHARGAEGGTLAPAPCAARARRADLPAVRRLARPARRRAAARRRAHGRPEPAVARRRRGARRARGGATPDRRRSPPLRDDTRLPRGRRDGGERMAVGGDRADPPGGAHDLRDASARRRRRARRRGACGGTAARAPRPRHRPRRLSRRPHVPRPAPGGSRRGDRRAARPRLGPLHALGRRSDRRSRPGRRGGGAARAPADGRAGARGRGAGGDDAAEEHLLLPKAPLGSALPAPVTDWLATCREAVRDVQRVLVELPTRSERETVVGSGMGGDETTAIDAAAEAAILSRLDDFGFTIVSEEVGRREGSGTYVVVDPIDGSINAKRGIPFFSVSIAVADVPVMDDVRLGYVYDFGSGEEWTARRGEGAYLGDERLGGVRPKDRIELLGFEATTTDLVARHAGAFVGVAHRLRIMGSLALSLCQLAA